MPKEQFTEGAFHPFLPPDPEDPLYMKMALGLARRAYENGDTPIGCVIVCAGKVIGQGMNERNARKDPTCHAEITAIRRAAAELGDWRLEKCTLYVTLEPCAMCAGAIIQSRIDRVVIGVMNPKGGCCGSVLDLMHQEGFNHRVSVTCGVMEEESRQLMQSFFTWLREKNRNSE